VNTDEINDVVYLLTNVEDDIRDGKWSVVSNATPLKGSGDTVSFQLERLVRGRPVTAVCYTSPALIRFVVSFGIFHGRTNSCPGKKDVVLYVLAAELYG